MTGEYIIDREVFPAGQSINVVQWCPQQQVIYAGSNDGKIIALYDDEKGKKDVGILKAVQKKARKKVVDMDPSALSSFDHATIINPIELND